MYSFMRFLHSIGPRNPAFIRKIRILGTVFRKGRFALGETARKEYHGNLHYYLKTYSFFLQNHCPNLEIFGVGIGGFCIKSMTSLLYRANVWQAGFFQLPWWTVDPEDLDIQAGDDTVASNLGQDVMETIRASRMERRCKKKAAQLLKIENDLATLQLKPLLDELVPTLQNLRKLEVKRRTITTWEEFKESPPVHGCLSLEEYLKEHEITWDASRDRYGHTTLPWVDMEIADDAKDRLKIAVLKRSREMEAADKLKALTLQDGPEASSNQFASQLDLPDNPPTPARCPSPRGASLYHRGQEQIARSFISQNWRVGSSPEGGQGDGQRVSASNAAARQSFRSQGGRNRGRYERTRGMGYRGRSIRGRGLGVSVTSSVQDASEISQVTRSNPVSHNRGGRHRNLAGRGGRVDFLRSLASWRPT